MMRDGRVERAEDRRVALRRDRQGGQTLIIAMIVLGVMLVIGFVFLGFVNRNIISAGRQQARTLAGDLAEAGIRYAHSQLLNSELGADWRGAYTPPSGAKDPDSDLLSLANGPDNLGPYTRVNFENGRALIRVRYGPADPSVFTLNPATPNTLIKPALARSYLLIESYGRPGSVANLSKDPTLVSPARTGNEKKLISMVSIGIIEHARFITDTYNVSRPAELGVPEDLGMVYEGSAVNFPLVIGTPSAQLPNFNQPGAAPGALQTVAGFGSLYCNSQLTIHGEVDVMLAQPMGDQIDIADTIVGAQSGPNPSKMVVSVSATNTSGTWLAPIAYPLTNASTAIATGPLTGQLASLNSNDDNFNTLLGVFRDSLRQTDQLGYARGVGRKDPPSILRTDADTGLNRYVGLTKESGPVNLTAGGNSGRYGHGRGVYVDNFDDRQAPADETGRQNVGTAQSQVYDWLNPNNGQANSGWQGPFYIPRGSFLKLLPDGFIIARDARAIASRRTWKDPDGTDSGLASIRYRIGNVFDSAGKPQPYIVDSLTVPDINAASIDYTVGQPFNGVIYFEGNVRVRGQIPTDIQLSVVSNATIYIEGSVTKGVVGNDYTAAVPPVIAVGALLDRPSASMLGLFAKDYVTLNTTQFFGSSFNQTLEEVKDVPTAVGFNPIRIRTGGGMLTFLTELLLDPGTGTAGSPKTYTPFALGYQEATSGTPALPVGLLMTQTEDDGPAPDAFTSININPGLENTGSTPQILPPYLFQEAGAGVYNSASLYFPPNYLMPNPPYTTAQPNFVPMYGLGAQSWQRYPKFETMRFPIADNTSVFGATASGVTGDPLSILAPGWSAATPEGTYELLAESTNEFQFYPNTVGTDGTNDLLFARLALAPHDIRIEAAIYAEQGSFFVIPGPPFNPNPNDTREAYEADVAANGAAAAGLDRLENFGNSLDAPFYNEPLDVRIQIMGAVSENMPPPISQQAEWLKRWGWIPGQLGGSGHFIPTAHTDGVLMTTSSVVPNLTIAYDPSLETAMTGVTTNGVLIRTDDIGRALPPIPRLPVSPTLAYFGEVNP